MAQLPCVLSPPLLLSKNWSTDVPVTAQNLGQFKNMPLSM